MGNLSSNTIVAMSLLNTTGYPLAHQFCVAARLMNFAFAAADIDIRLNISNDKAVCSAFVAVHPLNEFHMTELDNHVTC